MTSFDGTFPECLLDPPAAPPPRLFSSAEMERERTLLEGILPESLVDVTVEPPPPLSPKACVELQKAAEEALANHSYHDALLMYATLRDIDGLNELGHLCTRMSAYRVIARDAFFLAKNWLELRFCAEKDIADNQFFVARSIYTFLRDANALEALGRACERHRKVKEAARAFEAARTLRWE